MTTPNDIDDGCWDAFGDDDDSAGDEETPNEDECPSLIQSGVLFLTQTFLKDDPQLPLSKRRVAVVAASDDSAAAWREHLETRMFCLKRDDEVCDAAVLNKSDHFYDDESAAARAARRNVVAGGVLLIMVKSKENSDDKLHSLDERVWNVHNHEEVRSDSDFTLVAVRKHACSINDRSCPWAPNSASAQIHERNMLGEATVTRSAHEILNQQEAPLSLHKVQQASRMLAQHGYCVVRNLLNTDQCLSWGRAVLSDFEQANSILKEREGVDLKNPQASTSEPQNYRELAMREDLRMDLRDGPALRRKRAQEAEHSCQGIPDNQQDNIPVITTAPGSHSSCLRFHADILEIIRRTMNPKDASLYKGNLGRYNFDGSGPDGSYQPLRIGPMGGILSLPGSADQALHADTPHLFETLDCLPAHYINVFALGADTDMEFDKDGSPTGSTNVGGTAFVHGSHRLSFTAAIANNPSEEAMLTEAGREIMLKHLVRPSLQVGDVVLFDCRILHFGLANTSKSIVRPMLYVNTTHAFFHDPKNWDDRKSIFEQ